jgi:thioredoxin-like negative regulator of GroEL
VSGDSLESRLQQSEAIAVHFWAPWNGADPLMDRSVQDIVGQFTGRVQFLSSNIDTEPGAALAKRFGVANIPTLVILTLNQEPRLIVGHRDAVELAHQIELRLRNSQTKSGWAFWR